MRRYSEIPNTPTPYSKSSQQEFKIGSILTIPHTGKAVLRYIGPIEGKHGEFAGIELLGEGAALGKNSGDVDGVQYFKTKQPGAGLFMTLEKLKNSVEYLESPPQAKLNILNSPGIRFNATPSRNGTSTTKKGYHTPGLVSAVKKSHITNRAQSTPPPAIALTQAIKSPLEKELQRVTSTKLVIENERDNLLQQTETLKRELSIITSNFGENEQLIRTLEVSLRDCKEKYDKVNEKATFAENKLIKQRKVYEAQRKGLLEAIDQVEAQVYDNEQLYVGELKKLQEELNQKQEIIEDLYAKQKDLKYLHEKQKTSISSSGQSHELENEINNLKLTNLTQSKAIEHLRQDLKTKEERIFELNTESLSLKENHISENHALDEQMKEYKARVDNLSVIVDQKEQKILELKNELSSSTNNREVDSDQVIRNLQREIDSLSLKVGEKVELEKKIEELNKLIDDLQNNDSRDKLQELEFKLKNKESLIEDLKVQLIEQQNQNNDDDDNEKDNEIDELKLKLASKEIEIEELKKELGIIKKQLAELDSLTKNQLQEQNSFIQQQELKIQQLENEKFKALENSTLSAEKDKEIDDMTKQLHQLSLQNGKDKTSLNESKSLLDERNRELVSIKEGYSKLKDELHLFAELKTELELIKEEKNNLLGTISNKNQEIAKLSPGSKLKEISTQTDDKEDNTKELLEEKTLEIELLKEELLQLKSTDTQKEIQSLKNEIDLLDRLSRSTTNKELNHQIRLLKEELDSRPTIVEIQELRSELELIDELRRVESKTKDKEIHILKEKLNPTPTKTPTSSKATPELRRQSFVGTRTSMRPLSLNRPPIISQVVDGALQVYVPDSNKDPANGRHLWCGLCEKEGHDSIDCPYDNEIF